MNVDRILNKAQAMGVRLRLDGDRVKIAGPAAAIVVHQTGIGGVQAGGRGAAARRRRVGPPIAFGALIAPERRRLPAVGRVPLSGGRCGRCAPSWWN